MRIFGIVIAICLSLTAFVAIANAAVQDEYLSEGPLFVQNVTVIDGMGNPPVEGQDILIQDGQISAITATGTTSAPEGATVIDGKGLTAMPGLIDMHYHLGGGWTAGFVLQDKYPEQNDPAAIQQNLAALLYAGVTTAFDMGNPHRWIIEQRRKVRAGEYIAPRYFITGMAISQHPSGWDGLGGSADMLTVKIETPDREEIGKILDDLYVANDINFIKIYSGISALTATWVIQEAEERGLTVVADLWQLNMSPDWMRMTGLHGWAHATPNPVSQEGLDWMRENDKFVVANAVLGEKMAGLRVKEEGGSKAMLNNPLIVDIWGEEAVEDFYASYPDLRESLYEGPTSFYQLYNFGVLSQFRDDFLRNIKKAYDAGVLIAGGTDSPGFPSLWSGEAMHRELELLVMAGISPVEAIKLCTYNGARVLKKEDEFGSLQEGLVADIVLVSGKPWENISDSRNIEHVIVRGGLLNREKLLTSWK